MFIHIGNNLTISDKTCIGVFNIETLKMSDDNTWLLEKINSKDDKLIVLDIHNNITSTAVSPFTVIKRSSIQNDELIWSRKNDKEL